MSSEAARVSDACDDDADDATGGVYVTPWQVTLALAVLCCVLALRYLRRRHRYWQERGVPCPPAPLLLGHTLARMGLTRPFMEFFDELYYDYNGRDYCGFYDFLKPSLFVGNPQIIKTILVQDFHYFTDRRTFDLSKVSPIANDMLTNARGSHWRRIRSAVSPAFTRTRTRRLYPLLLQRARHLLHLACSPRLAADTPTDVKPADNTAKTRHSDAELAAKNTRNPADAAINIAADITAIDRENVAANSAADTTAPNDTANRKADHTAADVTVINTSCNTGADNAADTAKEVKDAETRTDTANTARNTAKTTAPTTIYITAGRGNESRNTVTATANTTINTATATKGTTSEPNTVTTSDTNTTEGRKPDRTTSDTSNNTAETDVMGAAENTAAISKRSETAISRAGDTSQADEVTAESKTAHKATTATAITRGDGTAATAEGTDAATDADVPTTAAVAAAAATTTHLHMTTLTAEIVRGEQRAQDTRTAFTRTANTSTARGQATCALTAAEEYKQETSTRRRKATATTTNTDTASTAPPETASGRTTHTHTTTTNTDDTARSTATEATTNTKNTRRKDKTKEETKTENLKEARSMCGRFTMDTIASCAFGLECEAMSSEVALFPIMAARVFQLSPVRALKMLVIAIAPRLAAAAAGAGVRFTSEEFSFFRRVVTHALATRRASHAHRGDFLDLLLETGAHSKHGLTDDTLAAQAILFLLAGYDNTANTLAMSLHLLAHHAHPRARLRREVAQALIRSGGHLSFEEVTALPYLDAVVSETLRLYPAAPVIERVCTQPCRMGGVEVGVGTAVVIPVWCLHRDPAHWPRPLHFSPERFLGAAKDAHTPYAYLPFGAGPRSCVGVRFAQIVVKIGLVSLLSGVDILPSASSPYPAPLDPRVLTLQPKGGLFVDLQPVPLPTLLKKEMEECPPACPDDAAVAEDLRELLAAAEPSESPSFRLMG